MRQNRIDPLTHSSTALASVKAESKLPDVATMVARQNRDDIAEMIAEANPHMVHADVVALALESSLY